MMMEALNWQNNEDMDIIWFTILGRFISEIKRNTNKTEFPILIMIV